MGRMFLLHAEILIGVCATWFKIDGTNLRTVTITDAPPNGIHHVGYFTADGVYRQLSIADSFQIYLVGVRNRFCHLGKVADKH